MSKRAIAAALMPLAFGAAAVSARSPVVRHRTTIGGWRLEVARDAFANSIACRLRGPGGSFYQGGAVGFRLGGGKDVTRAVYRVDRGPARSSRDDLPELIELGTPLETGPMSNPQQGVVHVPWRLLRAANSVAIQPAPGKGLRTFRLGGVRGLRELALARGCVPDARFVR